MRDDIPYEIWLPIFEELFDDNPTIADPGDSRYELSELQKRLNVHRHISLVCRKWNEISSDVFFQRLELLTPEALQGISQIIRNANTAQLVRQISFNFHAYRCGASSPRRNRKLREPVQPETPPEPPSLPNPSSPTSPTVPVFSTEVISSAVESYAAEQEAKKKRTQIEAERKERLAYASYYPSTTMQPQQWNTWEALVRVILAACTSISQIRIDANADYTYYGRARSGGNYRTLFGSVNLNNEAMLTGLLACSNLRVLHLVDPSPLEKVGPALAEWRALQEVHIIISPHYPEAAKLSQTIFSPPANLKRFRLHDTSRTRPTWPTSSDIASCTDLQSLDIGVLNLADAVTSAAAKFLIYSYQSTLIYLSVHLDRDTPDVTGIFSGGDLHFARLKGLHILSGTCHVSLFARLTASALEEVGVRDLDVDDVEEARTESYWKVFLQQPSLKKIKVFVIHKMGDPLMAAAFHNAASALDVDYGKDLQISQVGDEDAQPGEPDGEDPDVQVQGE